jgi:hypothetical protein
LWSPSQKARKDLHKGSVNIDLRRGRVLKRDWIGIKRSRLAVRSIGKVHAYSYTFLFTGKLGNVIEVGRKKD